MVPSRMRSVLMAAAVNDTHASQPHTGSHTKKPSHPACSTSRAIAAASPGPPVGRMTPAFTPEPGRG
jgi:hypothetical protein